jgi:4-hydroxybenzoate polyprenyltransferase
VIQRAKTYLKLIRIHQSVKNGFVLLPIFFGKRFTDPHVLGLALLAALAFYLASASIYVLNDLRDVAEDRLHPKKRFRPIASGAVGEREAVALALCCLGAAALLGALLGPAFLGVLGGYLALNLAYSLKLKQLAIVDIMCIAVGFVLRVFAGGVATDTWISHWIVLMTFLLALFLALAKRRDDLLLTEDGAAVRRSIHGYNREFVDASMMIMAAVTIVSYVLYTVTPEVMASFSSDDIYLTTFWVILGILRYLQRTFVDKDSGSPTAMLLEDRLLQLSIIGWLASFAFIIYFHTVRPG